MSSSILSTFLIFLGGGTGTLARYGTAVGMRSLGWSSGAFPTATLTVNIVGCLAIGLLAPSALSSWGVRAELRLALLVGLLGGFTTFSSFGVETVSMWNDGHHGRAIGYALLSNILGLAAAGLGLWLAGSWFGGEGAAP